MQKDKTQNHHRFKLRVYLLPFPCLSSMKASCFLCVAQKPAHSLRPTSNPSLPLVFLTQTLLQTSASLAFLSFSLTASNNNFYIWLYFSYIFFLRRDYISLRAETFLIIQSTVYGTGNSEQIFIEKDFSRHKWCLKGESKCFHPVIIQKTVASFLSFVIRHLGRTPTKNDY